MIEAIKTGYDSIKGALDIAQGFQALKTEVAVNQAVIDIQRSLRDAQRALDEADALHAADAKRIAELEEQIVELKNWKGEKERYQLNRIGSLAVAYTLKEGMDNGEATQWLCQPCFDDGHKNALQFSQVVSVGGGRGQKTEWQCGRCGNAIIAGRNADPSDPSSWD